MKKIFFVGIVLVFSFTLDADAQILHRPLFHKHGAHHAVLVQPIRQMPNIALPTAVGPQASSPSPSTATITVPRDVADSIKRTGTNLSDASTALSPLLAKYKLDSAPPSTSANSSTSSTPGAVGPAIREITPDVRQGLVDVMLGKQK